MENIYRFRIVTLFCTGEKALIIDNYNTKKNFTVEEYKEFMYQFGTSIVKPKTHHNYYLSKMMKKE